MRFFSSNLECTDVYFALIFNLRGLDLAIYYVIAPGRGLTGSEIASWCRFIHLFLLGFGEAWTDASYVQLAGLLVFFINIFFAKSVLFSFYVASIGFILRNCCLQRLCWYLWRTGIRFTGWRHFEPVSWTIWVGSSNENVPGHGFSVYDAVSRGVGKIGTLSIT